MEFIGRCAHVQALGVYIVLRITLLWKLIIINNNDKHIFRYQKHLSVLPTSVNMKFIFLACASSELLHAQEKETAEYPYQFLETSIRKPSYWVSTLNR